MRSSFLLSKSGVMAHNVSELTLKENDYSPGSNNKSLILRKSQIIELRHSHLRFGKSQPSFKQEDDPFFYTDDPNMEGV